MRILLTLAAISCAFAKPIVASNPADRPHQVRRSLSFTPQNEYTLAEEYDLGDTKTLFRVDPPRVLEGGEDPGDSQRLFLVGEDSDIGGSSPTITLLAKPTTIWRPKSGVAYQQARLRSLRDKENEPVEWEETEILAPDVQDLHTIGQLARMTGNAYALPGHSNWYDIDLEWNTTFPIGWEDTTDGFRGHVFVTPDNSTVVLSIKGTTLQGPTSKKDKFNDNLLFSCCCARVDISWVFSTVCDCYARNWRCDNTCLNEALVEDSLFYSIGVNLINNLTAAYPTSDIWLVGHSLGGGLASLLGTTFGLPAVAFEAPGERLAAERLHLPFPPRSSTSKTKYGSAPVTHIYHNADPIPQGVCTGLGSPCASAGFALETRCHLGRSIVYDTVGKLGWRVDVRKHPIRQVIKGVLEVDVGGWEDPDDPLRVRREVPVPQEEEDCIDCFKWEFGDFKDLPEGEKVAILV